MRHVLPIALIALVAAGFYVGATVRADLGKQASGLGGAFPVWF